MARLFTPFYQTEDGNGEPNSGALLYFYVAGTTTPVAVYQDAGATTPHANPVVASAEGIFPPIYISDGSYKTVLKTSDGVTIQTVDDIFGATTAVGISFDNTGTGLTATNVQAAIVALAPVSVGYTAASNAGPTTFAFLEDTDNGTNRVRLKAPVSLQSDVDVILPSKSGTLATLGRGGIFGLGIANNSVDIINDIDIAVGEASSDSVVPVLLDLSGALTKRLDAVWAVGTGNGGLDTGVIGDATYHVFLILRTDTGIVDALFSLSATAPTLPTGYDQKRRIGSIIRRTGAILQFSQNGDEFLWNASFIDVNNLASAASATTTLLTVPTGVIMSAKVSVYINSGGPVVAEWLSSLSVSDQAPGTGGYTAITLGDITAVGKVEVRTNTSAQIRRRESAIGGSITIFTEGYVDTRGRT